MGGDYSKRTLKKIAASIVDSNEKEKKLKAKAK